MQVGLCIAMPRVFWAVLALLVGFGSMGSMGCSSDDRRPGQQKNQDDDDGPTGINPGDNDDTTIDDDDDTTVLENCGNDTIDLGEVCDGTDVGGETCVSRGFAGGAPLLCQPDCLGYDTSNCVESTAFCGNNVRETGEVCDGTDIAVTECSTLGEGQGPVTCLPDCSGYDISACSIASCSGPTAYRTATLNTDLEDGEPCNFDSDCQNGCNFDYYCGPDGTPPTLHNGTLPLGAACDTHSSCESGVCWMETEAYVCVEPCNSATFASDDALECRTISQDSSTEACLPTGAAGGAIGDTCTASAFDCQSQLCSSALDYGDFCTDICDSSAECGANASCEWLFVAYANDFAPVCVPDTAIGNAGFGDDCGQFFECSGDLLCLGTCEQECTADGNECDALSGDYVCATDHPITPICVPSDEETGIGDLCESNSQCPDNALCYDAGEGKRCHHSCLTDACDGGVCHQENTSAMLDTFLLVYDGVSSDDIIAANLDINYPENTFSRLQVELEAGQHDLWIEVENFLGGPSGPYWLHISLDGAPSQFVAESELAGDNEHSSTTRLVAVDSIVEAYLEDVDFYRVTLDLGAPSTLFLETGFVQLAVCLDAADDGAPCTSDDACNNVCFPYVREGAGFCTSPCDDQCTDGACVAFTETNSSGSYCVPPGTKGFGEECSSAHECVSTQCSRHPNSGTFRCAAPCAEAGELCASEAGACYGADPYYGTACIPHLDGTVPTGGSCTFAADCQGESACVDGMCIPDTGSNYVLNTPVPEGLPCNLDRDCADGLSCRFFICMAPDTTTCGGEKQLCDGGVFNCSDVIDGSTGTFTCNSTCDGYDISTCSGLPAGQPCDTGLDCASGVCVILDSDIFVCADPCSGPSDASCDPMFATHVNTSCMELTSGTHACVPDAGSGHTGDACASDYLDCAEGFCWNQQFCIEGCSLSNPSCRGDASCRSFEYPGSLDTWMELSNAANADIGVWHHDFFGEPSSSFAQFTNNTGFAMLVYIYVGSWLDPLDGYDNFGPYQLQVFSNLRPPPFGGATTVLEAEPNDSMGEAQMLSNLPRRVQASLAEGGDLDVYAVEVAHGESLTVLTKSPLAQVCWPNSGLQRPAEASCLFDFQCSSNACVTDREERYCANECTGVQSCTADKACAGYPEDAREFCYKRRGFLDECHNAPVQLSSVNLLTQDRSTLVVNACPSGLCVADGGNTLLTHQAAWEDAGAWCSTACTSGSEDFCEYDAELEVFLGECLYAPQSNPDLVCVPHRWTTQPDDAPCLVDLDCQSVCCSQSSNTCVDPSTNECNW